MDGRRDVIHHDSRACRGDNRATGALALATATERGDRALELFTDGNGSGRGYYILASLITEVDDAEYDCLLRGARSGFAVAA